ncbi:MAG: hypothetical protein NTV74_03140 [Euryarchaeota archaeon]|nr:hypothetical protein [Euryarchaeota archaeon]
MPELEKSDIIKNLLSTVIDISGRKTNKGYAISTMDSLIKKLKTKFEFLKHIQIKDTRFSEDEDSVSVVSDINAIESSEVGKAINEIITTMDRSLGKNAGHFFIKEIQNTLSDEYNSSIKDMGVDLGLLQLEREVEEWEKMTTQKK